MFPSKGSPPPPSCADGDPSPTQRPPDPPTAPHVLVAVCLPLFAALAIAKAFASGTWSWWSWHFPFKWGLVVFHDLLFVVGWGAGGAALLLLARYFPARWRRAASAAFVAASTALVVCAIASVPIYAALRMYLTYPLMMMAGSVADVRSSIAPYLDRGVVLALIAGPVIYLGAVRALLRARWPGSRRTYAVLALATVAYLPVGQYGYRRWYAGGPDDGLAQNPHWAFVRSCAAVWRNDLAVIPGPPPGAAAAAAALQQEFLTVGERPPNPARGAGAPSSKIRNVIVVVLESVSTQFLGVYGSAYPTTPCLAAEAPNCVTFDNVYSNAGYSIHALMPLVLSLYPGAGWTEYPVTYPQIRGTSAAQVLRDRRGYRTAFMTGAVMDYKGIRRFYDNRGFDVISGCEDFQAAGVGTMVSSWGIDDPPLFDAMLSWIDREPGRPFYLMAWTQQTHHPYTLPPYRAARDMVGGPSGERSRMLNLYLNDLLAVDEQLGRLFAHLRQRGLADDTLVVITGDHGEGFGFPHPWTFHGTALYQESVNVPCVFWNPRLPGRGGRSDAVGSHVDLNPTLFDLLGEPPPGDWQGYSLFDARRPGRAYFACNTGNLLRGLREGDYKFIYNATLAREELYDLRTDPAEQSNVAKLHPDQCAAYRQRLAAWTTFQRQHLDSLTVPAVPAPPPAKATAAAAAARAQ